MAAQRVGDSHLTFGCTDQNWGYISNLTFDKGFQTTEAVNGQGDVVGFEMFQESQKCRGEYLYRAGSGSPSALVGTGTALSITDIGVSFYITSCSEVWSQGEWRKITFEGIYYPNMGS
jgi:hypothetical protein